MGSVGERGFILTPTYRVVGGVPEVHLHAVLEGGEPALVVDRRLAPYFFVASTHAAFLTSVVVTLAALAVFGFVKARLTGISPLRGGLQTVVTGGLAAGAAYAIAQAIG